MKQKLSKTSHRIHKCVLILLDWSTTFNILSLILCNLSFPFLFVKNFYLLKMKNVYTLQTSSDLCHAPWLGLWTVADSSLSAASILSNLSSLLLSSRRCPRCCCKRTQFLCNVIRNKSQINRLAVCRSYINNQVSFGRYATILMHSTFLIVQVTCQH